MVLTFLVRIHSQVIAREQGQTGRPDVQLLKYLLPTAMEGYALTQHLNNYHTPTGSKCYELASSFQCLPLLQLLTEFRHLAGGARRKYGRELMTVVSASSHFESVALRQDMY